MTFGEAYSLFVVRVADHLRPVGEKRWIYTSTLRVSVFGLRGIVASYPMRKVIMINKHEQREHTKWQKFKQLNFIEPLKINLVREEEKLF